MRVLILGDTHIPEGGQVPIQLLQQAGRADLVLHTGDFTSLDCYRQFESVAPRLYAVRGNRDRDELEAILLPVERFEVAGLRIVLAHGDQWGRPRPSRMARQFGQNADVVVYGHLHKPFVEQLGPCMVINPGSPVAPRSSLASYVVASFQDGKASARITFLESSDP
ncbi:MAG: metallophosphoesterase [Bacillota bacterium]